MISGQTVVFISSIEWDFLWQGHQEIATRFAESGNTVLYIENLGVRSPGFRDRKRIAQRLKSLWRAWPRGGITQVDRNLYVCPPLVLPPFGSRLRRAVNQLLLKVLLRRVRRRLNLKEGFIISYLPTDTAVDLAKLLRTSGSTLIYYCIADFSELTPHQTKLNESERTLVQTSDLLFAQCPDLAAHFARWTQSDIHIFPFGVNLERFDFDAARPLDNRQQQLPGPRIGYVGGIHKHFDIPLLVEMARSRPEWSWVLIGAIQTSVAALQSLPNVHLLGQLPHKELASHIANFDVCIVPYVSSSYTATVVPTKINEYLAMGKPVVSTTLRSVVQFNRDNHSVLVTADNSPTDFLEGIERALASANDPLAVGRRRAIAVQADWTERAERMSQLMEQALPEKPQQSVTLEPQSSITDGRTKVLVDVPAES